jgi:hypothetical protein
MNGFMLPPHIAERTLRRFAHEWFTEHSWAKVPTRRDHTALLSFEWQAVKMLRHSTWLVHIIIIWPIIAKEYENLGKTEDGGW